MTTLRHPDVSQEEDAVPVRLIALVAVFIVAVTLVLIVWAGIILRGQIAKLRPSGAFPEADLQTITAVAGVQQELFAGEGAGEAQRRRAERALDRFGWADRERGLVRMPIEEAMRRVAEEAAR